MYAPDRRPATQSEVSDLFAAMPIVIFAKAIREAFFSAKRAVSFGRVSPKAG